jgi:hypothetical protein
MQFLVQQEQQREEPQIIEGPDLKKEPLTKVAALYFEWKAANSSATVEIPESPYRRDTSKQTSFEQRLESPRPYPQHDGMEQK